MHAETWQEILEGLSQPWPEAVKRTRRGKGSAGTIKYIPRREIEKRLNIVCPDWSSDLQIHTTPDRLIVVCSVSIAGRTRAGVAEENWPKKDGGWTATDSAAARALKRACRCYGMPFTGEELEDDAGDDSPQPQATRQSKPAVRAAGQHQAGPGPWGWLTPQDALKWAMGLTHPDGAPLFQDQEAAKEIYRHVRADIAAGQNINHSTQLGPAQFEEYRNDLFKAFRSRVEAFRDRQ